MCVYNAVMIWTVCILCFKSFSLFRITWICLQIMKLDILSFPLIGFSRSSHFWKLWRFLYRQIYVSYDYLFNFVILFIMIKLSKIITCGCYRFGNCFPELQKLKHVAVWANLWTLYAMLDFIMKFQSFLCL